MANPQAMALTDDAGQVGKRVSGCGCLNLDGSLQMEAKYRT